MEEWLEDYDTRHVITACLIIYTIACAFLGAFTMVAFEVSVPFTMGDYLFAATYLPLPIGSKLVSILSVFGMIKGILYSTLFICCLLAGLFLIGAHRQNPPTGKFRVPLVPLIPALSILFNVGLIMHLSSMTWLRFFVWMSFGIMLIIITH